MNLTFDAGILEFQHADTAGTVAASWGIPLVRDLPGNLSIAIEDTIPLPGPGALIYLNFLVIGADSSNTVVHFKNITFNSGIYTVSSQDGTIDILGVVPVELSSFTATVIDGRVELVWQTATETNNYGFYIQRKRHTSPEWQTIGFVQGNGTTSSAQHYLFADENIRPGTWYYRLQQHDLDGTVNYSRAIEVNLLPTKFALYQNYPNPFNSATVIKYELPAGEHEVTLIIYDVLGNRVRTLVLNENQQAGVYQVHWDGRNDDRKMVSSGVYIYRLQVGKRSFIRKLLNLR